MSENTTSRTPAETLRAAAAKLREAKPAVATCEGWVVKVGGEHIGGCPECRVAPEIDEPWGALIVALLNSREALASLLEEIADQYEMPPCDFPDGVCNGCERRDDFVFAEHVAWVILGASETAVTA